MTTLRCVWREKYYSLLRRDISGEHVTLHLFWDGREKCVFLLRSTNCAVYVVIVRLMRRKRFLGNFPQTRDWWWNSPIVNNLREKISARLCRLQPLLHYVPLCLFAPCPRSAFQLIRRISWMNLHVAWAISFFFFHCWRRRLLTICEVCCWRYWVNWAFLVVTQCGSAAAVECVRNCVDLTIENVIVKNFQAFTKKTIEQLVKFERIRSH